MVDRGTVDPINNKTPVDPDAPIYKAIFDDLQGGTIKSYGRDFFLYLLIKFEKGKEAAAKQWIQSLSGQITSTSKQLEDTKKYTEAQKNNGQGSQPVGNPCINFFLSLEGYKYLGFQNQLLSNQLLKYSHENDTERLEMVHAAILLAHDDLDELETTANRIIKEGSPIWEIVTVETGAVVRKGTGDKIDKGPVVGAFGFRDGISQPLFLQTELEKLGIQTDTQELAWNSLAPLSLVLVEDPVQPGKYGSYCVLKKLETDYTCFQKQVKGLASALGEEEEKAAALAIGRYKDGTPLVSDKLNNFNYDSDREGKVCPFQAHIRKVNPRGLAKNASLNALPPLETQKKSRMFRAGVTYFGQKDEVTSQSLSHRLTYLRTVLEKIAEFRKTGEQKEIEALISGLMFVCFQSNISHFNALLGWGQNPTVPNGMDGPIYMDPITGYSEILSKDALAQQWPGKEDEPQQDGSREYKFQVCVQPLWGESFFVPGISFLKAIAST